MLTVKRVLLIENHALFREGLALLLNWELGLESIDAGSLAEGTESWAPRRGWRTLPSLNSTCRTGTGGADRTAAPNRTRRSDSGLYRDRSLARHARALEVGADEVLAKSAHLEQITGRRCSSSARMGRGWREDE